MFLKIIGSACVMAASCTLGAYCSFKTEYRIDDLLEVKKALLLLTSEIEFNLAPLAEAMKNVSLRIGQPFKKIFSQFSERLGKDDCSASELWKDVLRQNFKSLYLESEDFESLVSFGQALGYLDKQQQNNNIGIMIDYIDNKISELLEKSQKNKKMFKSLGFFGGFVILIVLF